jgi:hypothetical protein
VRRAVALLPVLLCLSACGYKLVRYTALTQTPQRVAIPTFVNDSFEPGLEFLVTDAFHREFLRRGVLELVDDPRQADLVIGGSVEPLDARARSFSSVDYALEYEVTLNLILTITNQDGEEIPLSGGAFVQSEIYAASSDVEVARTNREEALRRVAGLLGGRLHDLLLESSLP